MKKKITRIVLSGKQTPLSRWHLFFLALLLVLLEPGFLSAQTYPLQITIIPKVTYFPPYIGEYVDDPYRFFDVSVSNVDTETRRFYMVIRIEMVSPLDFTGETPVDNPPAQPLSIAPLQTGMSMLPPMWDQMLAHLGENDIVTTGVDIEDYRSGLALLPEGQYKACITAYDFDAQPGSYIPLSDPENICAFFTICYSATAPVLVSPSSCLDPENLVIAASNPVSILWTPPIYNCSVHNFGYTLKIVELLDGQEAETALEFNPVLLEVSDIPVPDFSLDTNLYPGTLQLSKTYAIRVTAENTDISRPIFITNDGASPACTFVYGNLPATTEEPEKEPAEPWTDPEVLPDVTPSTIADCFVGGEALSMTFFTGDLTGKRITVGHFSVVVASAVQNADQTYTGHGHLNWKPFGDTIKVKAEFANISVNTAFQVFAGEVYGSANTALDTYIPREIQRAKEWGDKVNNYAVSLGVGAATNPYHDRMEGYYAMLEEPARQIAQLFEGAPSYLPITIKSMVPSSPIDIGIIGMCLSPNSAKMNTLAVFEVPEAIPATDSKWLAFVGQGLCFTPDNLLFLGEGALFLAADFTVNLPASFDLSFKRATILGDTIDGTFVKWDNSGFRQARVQVDVHFPEELMFEDATGTVVPGRKVKASFSTHFRGWDNWIAAASMEPFQVEGIPSFSFAAQQLVYDHSATANEAGMIFPPEYTPNGNNWSGFYIKELSIKLPSDFKKFNEGDARTSILVQNMIIDEQGLTTDVMALNMINLSTGNLGGWAFSLDTLKLKIWKSAFNLAYIGGKFLLPISTTPLVYHGELRTAGKELAYTFNLRPSAEISMDMWLASLNLDASSHFEIKKDPAGVAIECLLNGSIDIASLDGPGIKFGIPDISFINFGMGNRNPTTHQPDFYMGIGTWSVASPQKTLGPFSVNYEMPKILREDNAIIGLSFTVGFGILTNFSCTTTFDVLGKLVWSGFAPPTTEFDEIRLQEITLEGEFNPVHVLGKLKFYYDDPVYGSGVKGRVVATFNPLLTLDATAQFGKLKTGNPYTYWYVDARAAFSPVIEAFPLAIGGFGGGVWYNMRATGMESSPSDQFAGTTTIDLDNLPPDQSVSGITYIPQNNSWGLKAGITLTLSNALGGGHVLNGSAWVSCTFTSGRFANLMITGDAFSITNYPGNTNSLIKATMNMGYDFVNNIFSFNLDAKANLLSSSITIPVWFWAKTDEGKWYFKLGDPHGQRMKATIFKIDEGPIKGHLDIEAYMALGNALDNTSLPDIPAIITNFLDVDIGKYRANPSKMGGARKGMLFGAKVDGSLDFDLILYAHLVAIAGFDVAMYHDENNNCNGTPAGYNGWYGNGQLYGYFDGDIGIKIDVWFFEGSVSLARLTAGALLIGGLPDPFWAFGKVKVRGSILGGLIKVSTSLEMKVGEPCFPGEDNPLANIRILEEIQPGYATVDEAKQYEPESIFASPRVISNINLSTNTIPREICLEIPPNVRNSNTSFRRYLFYIKDLKLYKGNAQTVPNNPPVIPTEYNVDNNTPTIVNTSRTTSLDPYTMYRIKAIASAKQYYPNDNPPGYGFPEINGSRQEHTESLETFFKTGERPNKLDPGNIITSSPLHAQRYFPKVGAYNIFLRQEQNYLFMEDGKRVESWIHHRNNTYAKKLTLNFSNVIWMTPNNNEIQNEEIYHLSLIRINEAKEQEFLQKLAIENRKQLIKDLLTNQVITSVIGGAGISSYDMDQITLVNPGSLQNVQTLNPQVVSGMQNQTVAAGGTVSQMTAGGKGEIVQGDEIDYSKPSFQPMTLTGNAATVAQQTSGLWNEALQEHNKKYKKDTVDYRQMQLEGKYNLDFIDTLFNVIFRTSRFNSIQQKMESFGLLTKYDNLRAGSANASEPYDCTDLIGIKSSWSTSIYNTDIPPDLKVIEDFNDYSCNDDAFWKVNFFDLTHEIYEKCPRTRFKARNTWIDNPIPFRVTFNNQIRPVNEFPVTGSIPSKHFPSGGQNRLYNVTPGSSQQMAYGSAIPLFGQELKANSGNSEYIYPDVKIKYLYNECRSKMMNDIKCLSYFGADYKARAEIYQSTNGSGRNSLSSQWIDAGVKIKYIPGVSDNVKLELPVYYLVLWWEEGNGAPFFHRMKELADLRFNFPDRNYSDRFIPVNYLWMFDTENVEDWEYRSLSPYSLKIKVN